MNRVKQLPQDDWTDQDLLTRAEAAERLDAEIEATTGELAALRRAAPPDPADRDRATTAGITLLDRRLDAMRAARAELRAG